MSGNDRKACQSGNQAAQGGKCRLSGGDSEAPQPYARQFQDSCELHDTGSHEGKAHIERPEYRQKHPGKKQPFACPYHQILVGTYPRRDFFHEIGHRAAGFPDGVKKRQHDVGQIFRPTLQFTVFCHFVQGIQQPFDTPGDDFENAAVHHHFLKARPLVAKVCHRAAEGCGQLFHRPAVFFRPDAG